MRIRREPWFVLVAAVALAPVTGCYRHTTVRATQLEAVVAQCNKGPRQIDKVLIDRHTQIEVDDRWQNLCAREWTQPSGEEIRLRRTPAPRANARLSPSATIGITVFATLLVVVLGVMYLVRASRGLEGVGGGW